MFKFDLVKTILHFDKLAWEFAHTCEHNWEPQEYDGQVVTWKCAVCGEESYEPIKIAPLSGWEL